MAEVRETLQGSLSAALAHASWSDTIDGVKGVLVHHLSRLHSGAEIKKTGFFNHTFAPDFTLTWANSSEPERRVYVRFPDNLPAITSNVERDLPEGSLVIGLGEIEGREEAPALADSSREHDTLVMDPGGLETLEESATSVNGQSILTTAVVKGARGLFGTVKSEQVAASIKGGLAAAARADTEATAIAAATSQEDFAPRQAMSLEYLLQTYWIAGGAQATEYPGTFQPGVRIDAGSLRLLLDSLDIEDMMFWRNLGADVSLDTIFAVNATENPSNLSRLIRANVDRFTAKAAWVRSEDRLRDVADTDYDWMLENDLLRLVGPTFSAFFARRRKRFTSLATRDKGITPDTLLERGQDLGIREVALADDKGRIVFSTDDITADERTAEVARSFGPDARIARAVATLGSGTHVTVDFEFSTVVAVTNSNPTLDGLAKTAVQALVDLDDHGRNALDEFLALPDDVASKDLLGVLDKLQMPQLLDSDLALEKSDLPDMDSIHPIQLEIEPPTTPSADPDE